MFLVAKIFYYFCKFHVRYLERAKNNPQTLRSGGQVRVQSGVREMT